MIRCILPPKDETLSGDEGVSRIFLGREFADRAVEIVVDRGIHAKVSSQEWNQVCRQMETAFKQSNYESGVIEGVQAVTRHLAAHFPAGSGNRNELTDKPAVL